ncbi:MAG: GPW/gp25 family protein [Cyanobacteria bacterium J06598_1]
MLSSQDLSLTRRQTNQVTTDRNTVDLQNRQRDLAVVNGRENLTQALLNRLHTRQGELTALGHPDYGSRLYQLIGELNNQRTRTRTELYVRESLAQEPRISEIIDIQFRPTAQSPTIEARTTLVMTITVQPVDDETLLTLDFSLNLGG